jgi:glycosyltransferase involved in cell wall biosynthesis
MRGLLIWAHGRCRATLAFYEGLAKAFGVPVRILCCYGGESPRDVLGLTQDEFPHLLTRLVGGDAEAVKEEYETHKDWHHFFGTYQKGTLFRNIMIRAGREGRPVAVLSEAPCVMCPPPRAFLHKAYIRFVLGEVVRRQIRSADYILNCSGNSDIPLIRIGWPRNKVIACGYYPPPLVGSTFVERTSHPGRDAFTLLMTGLPEWHRNPMVLLKALKILQDRKLPVRTVITQEGALTANMKRYVLENKLNVEFLGRVPLALLIELYQTCSCFVATGRAEPWGMRVNDALHCGAPLVVSTGMGAAKLVEDYGCGFAFKNDDASDLAEKLATLVADEAVYLEFSRRVKHASGEAAPEKAASRFAVEIRKRFPGWR